MLEPYQVVRELAAGTLTILNFYFLFAFGMRMTGFSSWKEFREDKAAQGATALATYFLGAALMRLWDYVVYYLTNLNITYDFPTAEYLLWLARESWWFVFITCAIMLIGGFCGVRVFNPPEGRWGRVFIIGSISILVPVVVMILFHGFKWVG